MRIANLESNSALERIAASSNTEVPAFLSILKLNYSVIACDDGLLRCKSKDSSTEYIAESMIEILGLISMHKYRGKDWRAKDEEVESYLKQFSTKE